MDLSTYWECQMEFGDALPLESLIHDYNLLGPIEQFAFSSRLAAMDYPKFLGTRYWYAIRLNLYATRKACECCHKSDGLEVHHVTYVNRGYEHCHLDTLSLLCNLCHAIISLAVETIKGQQRA